MGKELNRMDKNNSWFNETVDTLEKGNWLYNVICFLSGRRKKRMTYGEIYLVLVELNRKALGEQVAKEKAINRVVSIYKEKNGKIPEGVVTNGNE